MFENRGWALITGASSGIGRSLAKVAAADGYDLVLCARSGQELEAVAGELESAHGVETRVVAVDLASEDGPAKFDEATSGLHLSVVVLAAGFGTSGPFLDNDVADELGMIDLNCRALAESAHRFGNRMRSDGIRGNLILFSSLVAFQGVPLTANYAATKAYVQTLAEGLADELANCGISVMAAAPGPVDTGFGKRADMTMNDAISPDVVANEVWNNLGKSRTIHPGFMAKFLSGTLAPLPRRTRTKMVGKAMAKNVNSAT